MTETSLEPPTCPFLPDNPLYLPRDTSRFRKLSPDPVEVLRDNPSSRKFINSAEMLASQPGADPYKPHSLDHVMGCYTESH